jgi:hypothetical protein
MYPKPVGSTYQSPQKDEKIEIAFKFQTLMKDKKLIMLYRTQCIVTLLMPQLSDH